uniref:Uncharacterized protein n=1 Tax=Kalanchoe fedtschenkoi TaxID=63787 RepID=A0A7N1A9A4_KALFE
MSSGEVRRVSRQDIQLNLIERCLQLYMNQEEVVKTLLDQAKIEPGFTELVWQKLEEENREFFKAYHLRLIVKQQIMVFNKLLEQQVEMMRQIHPTGVSSRPISNGSQLSTLLQGATCYSSEHTGTPPNNMVPTMMPNLPNAFTNGNSSLHANVHATVDMSAHTRRMDISSNMLPMQTPNMGLVQGINGGMVKSEPSYQGSPFIFSDSGNVLETRSTIPVASFSGADINSQPMGQQYIDAEMFGRLGQIPRNFSLSDIAADFAQASDIMDTYARTSFLSADTDNFLDGNDGGESTGDNNRLDTISEGLSFEDFTSE